MATKAECYTNEFELQNAQECAKLARLFLDEPGAALYVGERYSMVTYVNGSGGFTTVIAKAVN